MGVRQKRGRGEEGRERGRGREREKERGREGRKAVVDSREKEREKEREILWRDSIHFQCWLDAELISTSLLVLRLLPPTPTKYVSSHPLAHPSPSCSEHLCGVPRLHSQTTPDEFHCE